MRENDNIFINQVVYFYYTTVDSKHPQGSMSTVAEHFAITRAKVNKILITAGVIDSPLHQDIMKLKERGYETDDIAATLGVSAATVKINLPYEKVIYNGEFKSTGAGYVEEFRKREQVFLKNVVRKPTELEMNRMRYYSGLGKEAKEYMDGFAEQLLQQIDIEDDPIHLMPVFTKEESELFQLHPDVTVLHVELDADLTEVRDLAEIKYCCEDSAGQKRYTISRDILVPDNIPLHNLHYAINQAFGFTNSHLHEYTLPNDDLSWVTCDKVMNWKKLVGLVFKNPLRDENIDFWDDDYEGGSPKKWMRSKYTGPRYQKLYEESYPYIKNELDEMEEQNRLEILSTKIEDLRSEFYLNPLAVNEALPVSEILSEDGWDEYENLDEYYAYMDECLEDAAAYPPENPASQPFVYSFASSLIYSYDFGDGWDFTIKPYGNVEYLVEQGRITAEQIKEAIKDVCTIARPIVIAADGLPLVEDVGGVHGFIDFLKGINGMPSSVYADKEESLIWAKNQGWNAKIGNLKSLL